MKSKFRDVRKVIAWTVSKQIGTILESSRSQVWYLDAGYLGWGEEAGKMMGKSQLLALHSSALSQ